MFRCFCQLKTTMTLECGLQMFPSSPTSTHGCVPGDEYSVWPVSGLRVYEAWALLGEPGWEFLKSRESCGKINGNLY